MSPGQKTGKGGSWNHAGRLLRMASSGPAAADRASADAAVAGAAGVGDGGRGGAAAAAAPSAGACWMPMRHCPGRLRAPDPRCRLGAAYPLACAAAAVDAAAAAAAAAAGSKACGPAAPWGLPRHHHAVGRGLPVWPSHSWIASTAASAAAQAMSGGGGGHRSEVNDETVLKQRSCCLGRAQVNATQGKAQKG